MTISASLVYVMLCNMRNDMDFTKFSKNCITCLIYSLGWNKYSLLTCRSKVIVGPNVFPFEKHGFKLFGFFPLFNI